MQVHHFDNLNVKNNQNLFDVFVVAKNSIINTINTLDKMFWTIKKTIIWPSSPE
ncbi:hypothetical protein [Mesomycoplasma bovoculi]|uniref:Uncharacterized protein n=1 Tax=Mesomycoplasma bovoculi M165/69 TaxID=743966 RepID=W5UT13_9BACT|nr:hypothetical protein [Mesomycoplasma bovoculi]AHH45354.1 hypothetical protein MYB_01723 [Mesomycoplasma bovoculi M165/69]